MKKKTNRNNENPPLNKTAKQNVKLKEKSGFIKLLFQRHFNFAAILIIAILGFLAYSNTFHAEMQFDDGIQIANNDIVKDLSHFASLSEWIKVNKRPLSYFGFALNYDSGGVRVGGYHFVNLMIHLLSAVIVFFLSRLIFSKALKKSLSKEADYLNVAALFTALLFVAHPIQTQAVTYIVQRMTSQSAMFYLLAVLLYALGRRSQLASNNRNAMLLYVALIFSAICSLLSKQIAVTIPFTLLMYEYFFVRNKDGKPYTRYIIISLSLLMTGIVFVFFSGLLPAETEDISRTEYLITQSRVIVKYIQLLIFPINQNVDYSFPVSETLWGWKELLSTCFTLGILGLAIALIKKKPIVSFGIFWIYLTLSVESSIIPIRDVIFEHRLYLPMFGFALIITDLIWSFFGQKKIKPAILILGFILLILSISTYSRNRVWQTQYSLWKDVVKKSPDKIRPLHNLINLYSDDGRHAEAIQYAEKAISLDPLDGHAYFVAGICNERAGNMDQAIRFYKQGIEVDTSSVESMNNLGNIYLSRNEYPLAIKYFKMALTDTKKEITVLKNLVIANFKLKDYKMTIKYAKAYLRKQADDVSVLTYLGDSYLYLKQSKKAIDTYKEVIKINPQKVSTYNNLGTCYYYESDYENAAFYYSEALKIDPENKNAKRYLSLTKKYLDNE